MGNDYRTIYRGYRQVYIFDLRIRLYRTTYTLAEGTDAGGRYEEGKKWNNEPVLDLPEDTC